MLTTLSGAGCAWHGAAQMDETELMIVNLKNEIRVLRRQRDLCTCATGAPGVSTSGGKTGPKTLQDYEVEVSHLTTGVAEAGAAAARAEARAHELAEENAA
jgi:hypothetical protein